MLEFIDGQLDGGNNIVHSSDIFPNISMDVLAAVGLGVHINSFKDPCNEFKRKVDDIFDSIVIIVSIFVSCILIFTTFLNVYTYL